MTDVPKAIELDFPFEELDIVAESESWRKEVNRPNYHIHKWWANRLGSVFRAIVIGAISEKGTDIWKEYYKKHQKGSKVVLDPFMGSGTTLGECVKLGVKPVGCDINPISTFIVEQSLANVDLDALDATYQAISSDVQSTISSYYQTQLPGELFPTHALYYFWVKEVSGPKGERIPLFSSYVFAKDAYPSKKPEAKILCPSCGDILIERYDCASLKCSSCGHWFNPQTGTTKGQLCVDKEGNWHKVKDLVRQVQSPPEHRLYAVVAMSSDTSKRKYIRPTAFDYGILAKASSDLKKASLPLPDMEVREGHNTNQARGYNYNNWRDFFSERQLLSLGILLERILKVEDAGIRNQFLCLFSGTLEFNNLFCSFKGEGTGAVRHMFANHILKPTRTPLENTVWGTPKSSGTFSTLYKSRLLRAKEYLRNPFELKVSNNGKRKMEKVVCSESIDALVTNDFDEFTTQQRSALVLNGDSGNLPIADRSVDAVVTDPPYFDFVHYSELSDFFYAWLSPVLKTQYHYFSPNTSGREQEVQHKDHDQFSSNLCRVFKECRRTLKDDGVLVFSFHHSRAEAWLSVYRAIVDAGFTIAAAHPVKAEMSVGSPKSAAKNPINLDAIIVCKKRMGAPKHDAEIWSKAWKSTGEYANRLLSAERALSIGDLRVILSSQLLVASSKTDADQELVGDLLARVYSLDSIEEVVVR